MFPINGINLVVAALVACTVLTATRAAFFGHGKPDRVAYEVSKNLVRDEISHDELKESLGRTLATKTNLMADPRFGFYSVVSKEQTIDFLLAAKDKDKPGVIFGKFSVNDLLRLNKVYTSDYNKAELERRRKVCKDIEAEPVTSENSLAKSNQKRNLLDYCTKTLDVFEDGYSRYLVKYLVKKLAKSDFSSLMELRREFTGQLVKNNVIGDRNELFKEFIFDRIGDLAKVEQSCEKVSRILADAPQDLRDKMLLVRECKVILSA